MVANLKNFGGIYAIKPWWQRRLYGLENWLVNHQIHPDFVTLEGVAVRVCWVVR